MILVQNYKMTNIRCVVVGDGGVGKTSLCICYTTNKFPGEFVPTVFDNYTLRLNVEDTSINLQIWDSAGQEDYDKVRHLIYRPKTDVVILCFSLVSLVSLENIEKIWIPEINQYCQNASYILVGLKSDLRDAKNLEFISNSKCEEIKQKINAYSYVECSSSTHYNVNEVFESACKSFLYHNNIPDSKKDENSSCILI